MTELYEFVFILPTPPIMSYPPGGMNIIYRLASHMASTGNKSALLFVKLNYNGQSRLSNFLVDVGGKVLFKNKTLLKSFQSLIGIDYDYKLLDNVDIFFSDGYDMDAVPPTKRLFITDHKNGKMLHNYLQTHPRTEGYNIIQNFEDSSLFTDKPEGARETYLLQSFKKIVICQGLYDKFSWEKPLRFNVGIDEVFKPSKDHSDPYSILFPLRTDKSKGSEYALEAARILHEKSSRYAFIAYGNVPKKDVPAYIDYHYKPKNKELAEIYNSAGIFIFPSLIEGFGSGGCEAMACGCAVVLTDSIGVKEYAKPNTNCIMVKIKDTAEIVNAIELLETNETLRKTIVLNGIKSGISFTYQSMYESFSRMFLK